MQALGNVCSDAAQPVKTAAKRAAAGKRRVPLKEKLVEGLLLVFALLSGILVFFVMLFVVSRGIPVLEANGWAFVTTGGWDEQFVGAWVGGAGDPVWQFGALPLITGTLYTTFGALLIAVPFGLGCAIFLVEMCPVRLKKPLESTVRLLAAIPSVVYGLVGLIVVVPFIADTFIDDELALRMINVCAMDGTSLLAGMIVLSMMIAPIFIALSSDALRAVPRRY